MEINYRPVTKEPKDFNKIINMMYSSPGIKEIFYGKETRVYLSPFILMIQDQDKDIGFAYLVDEQVDGMYFVDVGILEEYRGKGIGKDVLEEFQHLPTKWFIMGETKKDNVLANESSKKYGVVVAETEDRNIYLLQKDRLEEFIDSDSLEKLAHSRKFNDITKVYKKS